VAQGSVAELGPDLPLAASITADVDEVDAIDGVELPGADVSGEELLVRVVPQQADEFTCSRCFLVQHRHRRVSAPDTHRSAPTALLSPPAGVRPHSADTSPRTDGDTAASDTAHGPRTTATMGGPDVGGREVAVGPFLGQWAGLAEHDRHVGPADLKLGATAGDHRGAHPVEFEDARVTVLDHQGRAG